MNDYPNLALLVQAYCDVRNRDMIAYKNDSLTEVTHAIMRAFFNRECDDKGERVFTASPADNEYLGQAAIDVVNTHWNYDMSAMPKACTFLLSYIDPYTGLPDVGLFPVPQLENGMIATLKVYAWKIAPDPA